MSLLGFQATSLSPSLWDSRPPLAPGSFKGHSGDTSLLWTIPEPGKRVPNWVSPSYLTFLPLFPEFTAVP